MIEGKLSESLAASFFDVAPCCLRLFVVGAGSATFKRGENGVLHRRLLLGRFIP